MDDKNKSRSLPSSVCCSNLTGSLCFEGTNINQSSHKTPAEDNYPFYVVDRVYLMTPICAIGIVFNVLNIIVLTRKRMRSSINFILTCLAISDLINIIFEILVPILVQSSLPPDVPSGYSLYHLAIVCFIDYYVSFWFCNVSNWITVTVGTWRYLAVTFPLKAQIWFTTKVAKWAVCAVVLVSSTMALPEILLYGIRPAKGFDNATIQIYEMHYSSFAKANNMRMYRAYQYAYVFMRLLPSVILLFVTFLLIRTLCKISTVRRQLSEKDENTASNQFDRTTVMMLVILACFLVSNLPYSILITVDMVIGQTHFDKDYFQASEDFFQLAIVLNYTINFPVYYIMSRKFRNTFLIVFCAIFPKIKQRLGASSENTIQTRASDYSVSGNLRSTNSRRRKSELGVSQSWNEMSSKI